MNWSYTPGVYPVAQVAGMYFPEPLKEHPAFTVIEVDGRFYATRVVRIPFKGIEDDVFQRIPDKDGKPWAKKWHGTMLAADAYWDEACRRIKAFRTRGPNT